MVLRQHAVAENRHRGAHRLLAVELDREGVHRDRADHAPQLAADPHLGSGQIAAKPVRVADRHDPDPGRPFRDEPPPVAAALARLQALDLREIAPPRKRGLEAVRARVLAEGREAVQRDPAASSVEARRREPQRGRAVGDVAHQVGVRLGRLAEALDLLLREGRVGVGCGQVRHEAHHLGRRLRQLAEPPAAHARVELQVHAHAFGNLVAPDRKLELGLARLCDLAARRGRAHHQDPGERELSAQLQRLGHGRDAQGSCALVEHRAGDVHRSVAVGVRLHDRPELRALERPQQRARVAPHCAEIDGQLRPVHRAPAAARRRCRSRSRPTAGSASRRAAAPRLRRLQPGAAPSPSRGTRPRSR